MIGGLLKTTSVAALVAVAGLAAGSMSANAADFGGDCCADLEERVAELEATTARKGNRKVSLTVYGQVNTAVMFWDAGDTFSVGDRSDVYVVDNDISSTRFGFKGKAKITPDWSAGFKIEVETQMADSNEVDGDANFDEGFNGLNIRKAEWYLQSKTFGKLTVGQGDFANSGITEIDLSGTNIIAQFDDLKFGEKILTTSVFDPDFNNPSARNLEFDDLTRGGNFEYNRGNRVRYDTPTFAGFIVSAAWGEDDAWDVALRYAGELGDFKLAAGIAYGQYTDFTGSLSNDNNDCDQFGCLEAEVLNGSVSVIHNPTGLFVTAMAAYRQFDNDDRFAATNTFTGAVEALGDEENTTWAVRAGISQKWIPLGKTAIYGEYRYTENDNFEAEDLRINGINTETEIYGAGIVQKIDAAAMELYLGYKHITNDDNIGTGYDDMDVVISGARIKF